MSDNTQPPEYEFLAIVFAYHSKLSFFRSVCLIGLQYYGIAGSSHVAILGNRKLILSSLMRCGFAILENNESRLYDLLGWGLMQQHRILKTD